MPVTLSAQGKADWTDYQDYWRDDDAEWLQERSIVRYATSAARASEWPTPSPGHVTYNQATDQLEHFAGTTPTKWIGVLASQHLLVTPKTSANDSDPVVIGHKGAGGGGLQFFPTVSSENKVALTTGAYLDIGGGSIVAKASGLTIKTGTNPATTLSTDADALVIDTKIEAPNATLGALTVSGTTTLGALAVTGAVSGITNVGATTGVIGGVQIGTSAAHGSGGVRADAQGFTAQGGSWNGNSTSAWMRYRNPSGGAFGSAYFSVDTSNLIMVGGLVDVYGSFRHLNDSEEHWYGAAGFLGYGGPVIYSGANLAAANYPNGTIWISP